MANISNSTYDDLMRLNDEKAITLIPVISVCALFIVIGLVGNSLVCYVIGFKFKINNHNLLIVWLAIFDLFSCLLTMPRGIIEARYLYSFPSATFCKIFRFFAAFTYVGSVLVLGIIAVDRYKTVCRPLSAQMSLRKVTVALTVATIGAALIATPASIIYGLNKFDSPVKGQMAQLCFTTNEMKDTAFPLLYTATLFTVFISVSVTLIIMYGMIWVKLRRHERNMKKQSGASGAKSKMSSDDSAVTLSVESEGMLKGDISMEKMRPEGQSEDSGTGSEQGVRSELNSQTPLSNTKDISDSDINITKILAPKNRKQLQPAPERKKNYNQLQNKATRITFVVTIVFILSFLPYLTLRAMKNVYKGFDYDLRGAYLILHNFVLRSYYINSVANPIIYGAFNLRFRNEVKILCRKLFCRRSARLNLT